MSLINALLHNVFLQNALLAGLLLSICGGIMGSYSVVKKITSLSGSIAHSIIGGIGFFIYLKYNLNQSWADPLLGAFLAAIISAFLIGLAHLKYKSKEDIIISAIWSIGMAIGIIFASFTPNYTAELANLLFGNILWTTQSDLIILALLDVLIILCVSIFYRRFLVICFDEELAILQGTKVRALYFLLLSLIAISAVLLIQIIGIILMIALLTIPAALASLFTKRFFSMMILSIFLCALFNFSGTICAYELNWPVGPTIALLSAAAYLFFLPKSIQENRLRKKL
jgi:zinc transport system permease protein